MYGIALILYHLRQQQSEGYTWSEWGGGGALRIVIKASSTEPGLLVGEVPGS